MSRSASGWQGVGEAVFIRPGWLEGPQLGGAGWFGEGPQAWAASSAALLQSSAHPAAIYNCGPPNSTANLSKQLENAKTSCQSSKTTILLGLIS